jgi:predicted naringenin-chalcone synthase
MKIDAAIAPLLAQAGLAKEKVDLWAVHPGGRAIIDKVREGLGASEAQVEVSRNVLRRVGNLSSATILFVLEELLYERASADAQSIVAMAFGPGLTIESGVFTLHASKALA